MLLKKTLMLLAFTLFLYSCGGAGKTGENSLEGDAKKAAELMCKINKLSLVENPDEKAIKEMKDLDSEIKKLQEATKEKYKTEEDKKKFEKIMMDAMKECKSK